MNYKLLFILFAIVWFCVGGMVSLGFTNWYWHTKILPDMYNAIDKCWSYQIDKI